MRVGRDGPKGRRPAAELEGLVTIQPQAVSVRPEFQVAVTSGGCQAGRQGGGATGRRGARIDGAGVVSMGAKARQRRGCRRLPHRGGGNVGKGQRRRALAVSGAVSRCKGGGGLFGVVESSIFARAGVVRSREGGRSRARPRQFAKLPPLQGPSTPNRLIGKWIAA